MGGNFVYDFEKVFFYIEMVMGYWGYCFVKVVEYCDLLK